MDLFSSASIIVVLAAIFGFINARFLRLPNAIGLMIVAIVSTLLFGASTWYSRTLYDSARQMVLNLDFEHILLDVMLGFLLFAGALHTNLGQLRIYRWPILIFATVSVLLSALITASLCYFAFRWLKLDVTVTQCLLFGALISPTDPIAVMGILRKANVPKGLEIKIVGESLFNDGVGVVLFMAILNFSRMHGSNAVPVESAAEWNWSRVAGELLQLLGQEVLGGLFFGLILGYLVYLALKSIDNYEIEILITLACVMGGYSLAHYLHLSAPLAMVVAGLIIGNDKVRSTAMSKVTQEYVDKFWELTDVLLNVLLFVLIGLEILVIEIKTEYMLASGLAILIVLTSRFVSLIVPIHYFRERLNFAPYTAAIMTWGGLRGGISIALALSLTQEEGRNLFLAVTYGVVIFSIVVQGLTIERLTRSLGLSKKIPNARSAAESTDP